MSSISESEDGSVEGDAMAPEMVAPETSSPESNGSNEPGMGIRFVYDDPEERLALERRVERLMTGSLGPLIYGRLFHDRGGR